MNFLKLVIIVAIAVQLAATIYATRLIKRTRYNVIWILFITGMLLLAALLVLTFMSLAGTTLPVELPVWLAAAISVCLSVSAMYAYKLVEHVDNADRNRELYNKRLLTAVLRAEEKSRSTFSKELHDGLGPLLSSAKMSLSALSAETADCERNEITESARYVIDEAIRSLREISNNLSPHVLSDFGLSRGIRTFINRGMPMHDGVKIRFTTDLRDERFDPDVEVIIYRVVCELINNSLKHSACSRIDVSLTVDGQRLSLRYSDNGRGFNPSAVSTGMGLANISSRVNSLNGSVSIESAPGAGMKAAVTVDIEGGQVRGKELDSGLKESRL
ncbi:MAG: sensor histidine kinase [Alistipes sp.]|nr:sensor histidine kinase [Alistipes sp.]